MQEERARRLIRGALEDLERGEAARASAALESVLRTDPKRAEAHWYLALLARQRGRYDSAEVHLRAFLAAAGDDHEPWREAAERKLAALEDERRLADEANLRGEDEWVDLSHPHFRVHYDADLGKSSDDYAATVLRYLEEAHADVAERLGAAPREPLGVMFYGKAAYLRAHQHRFSFQTVGFFDGRIHVVSAAHPADGCLCTRPFDRPVGQRTEARLGAVRGRPSRPQLPSTWLRSARRSPCCRLKRRVRGPRRSFP